MTDHDRLRHLAAEGDVEACKALARLETRKGAPADDEYLVFCGPLPRWAMRYVLVSDDSAVRRILATHWWPSDVVSGDSMLSAHMHLQQNLHDTPLYERKPRTRQ